MFTVIRKSDREPSLLPLPLIGLIISILFIIIYTTIFTFANPKTDSVNALPDSADGTAANGIENGSEDFNLDTAATTLTAGGSSVILAVGTDEVSGLADVVMLASFDTVKMKLNVVQIPRDTYFRCTDRTYRKINGAMSALGGIENFAAELGAAFGIKIDYTVRFTLDALGKIVDKIGGVPVSVPFDMDYDDPYQGLAIHLPAGDYILDGEQAKQFVRYRSGYIRGDIARTDAQKIFMAAFVRKLTDGVGILKIPGLISVVMDDISTNMSFMDCLSFAQKALSLKTKDVKMITMTGQDARAQVDSGAWYYIINRAAALEIVNRYLNTTGEPIADADFDPQRLFTDEDYPHYEIIYYDTGYEIKEYSADDINKNGIGIGLTGN